MWSVLCWLVLIWCALKKIDLGYATCVCSMLDVKRQTHYIFVCKKTQRLDCLYCHILFRLECFVIFVFVISVFSQWINRFAWSFLNLCTEWFNFNPEKATRQRFWVEALLILRHVIQFELIGSEPTLSICQFLFYLTSTNVQFFLLVYRSTCMLIFLCGQCHILSVVLHVSVLYMFT